MKIALALICKGTDEEAKLLDRCLSFSSSHVDGIFVTVTQQSKAVEKVVKKYKGHLSFYEWDNNFANARNFNFAQVSKEFTHILWMDADDGVRGLENLRHVVEENPNVDGFTFNYLYDFDEYKQPTIVHLKTQVVKNDGCVEWRGALHEDFKENRQLTIKFVKDIERIHLSSHDRFDESKKRNVEVSKADLDRRPDDPRSYWNYGGALFGAQRFDDATMAFRKFLEMSQSEEEKYLVYLKLSAIANHIGKKKEAIDLARTAIGIRPLYPDAFHYLGQIYYDSEKFREASEMILQGLTKKPPYYSIIVYNPREYDVVPLTLLAKTFYRMSRPDQAITCLQNVLKMEPKNKEVKKLLQVLKKENKIFEKAIEIVASLKDIKDKDELKKALDNVPEELQSYPAICAIRHTNFIKETSSGKDLSIYCSYTTFEWSSLMAKTKGVGGSEEAVINLSKEWAKKGWNVTVYNNCGHKAIVDENVTYRPYWEFNVRDKQDVVILWRSPRFVDYNINCEKILIDVHDVIPPGEFNEERLKKIYKVMLKTEFHRSLFPNIPDDKIAVIPNGMDFNLFEQSIKKDRYLIVNTSSPDRSMDVLPKLFKRVKERVPEAKCKWAYGFDIFDGQYQDNARMLDWRDSVLKDMKESGIENLGRLSQTDCAKLYLEANVLAYPTEFAEIDCITVKKAQACGAIPITTDFGALEESVQFGVKVHSTKTKDSWCRDGQFHFGLEDEKAQDEWVDAVVKRLRTPLEDRKIMRTWAEKFQWPLIAERWGAIL